MESIQKGPNEVALQGVEFWSTVSDEEIYLIQELEDAQEEGREPTKQPHYFIRGALKFLVPRLLEALTKQVSPFIFFFFFFLKLFFVVN